MKLSSLKENRWLLIAFGVIQTSCISGIMFGWAGIAGTLLIAPIEDGGAGLTLMETTQIFAMVASTASFSPFALGIVLDKYGPRVTAVLSNVIIAVGLQTIACAHSYGAFAIGACTVAFGGPGIQNSTVSFANLFPENQFLVLSGLNGSIAISFAILPFFGILWESYGVGVRTMFQTYIVVTVVLAVCAFLLLPDSPVEQMDDFDDLCLLERDFHDVAASPVTTVKPQTYEPTPERLVLESTKHMHLIEQPLDSFLRQDPHHELERHGSFKISKKALEKGDLEYLSLKDMPFWKQVTSGCYIRALIVFVVNCLFANFYIATITTELADFVVEYPLDEQHQMTRTFSLIMSFGIFGSFVAGWLMDLVGLETCTLITLSLGALHLIVLTLFASNMPIMTLGFVVYTLFRQFLYPVFIASVSAKLGFKYFGILLGVGYATSGLAQLFIAPVAQLVRGTCHLNEVYVEGCSPGAWKELHMIQTCVFVVLGILPIWDHRVEAARQRAVLRRIQSQASFVSYGAMEASPQTALSSSPNLSMSSHPELETF